MQPKSIAITFLFTLLLLIKGCGAADSGSGEDSTISPYASADVKVTIPEIGYSDRFYLAGALPIATDKKEYVFFLARDVAAGSAERGLRITIKDSNGLSGAYSCKGLKRFETSDLTFQGDGCEITYTHDSYIENQNIFSESYESNGECDLIINSFKHDDINFLQSISISFECRNMPAYWAKNKIGGVNISGTLTESKSFTAGSLEITHQGLRAQVNIEGGNGHPKANFQAASISTPSYNAAAGSHWLYSTDTEDKNRTLAIKFKAPYQIIGEYSCIERDSLTIGSHIPLKKGECHVDFQNQQSVSSVGSWLSSTQDTCKLTITRAEHINNLTPLKNFTARLDCRQMQTWQSLFGYSGEDYSPIDLTADFSFD